MSRIGATSTCKPTEALTQRIYRGAFCDQMIEIKVCTDLDALSRDNEEGLHSLGYWMSPDSKALCWSIWSVEEVPPVYGSGSANYQE
jgi:hypothetical protein